MIFGKALAGAVGALAATLLLLPSALAPDSETFSKEIARIYGFTPATATRQEKLDRGLMMDKFWDTVKTYPEKYLPLLREELAGEGRPPFFYYDGAKLLLAISSAPDDKALALKAIARTDLSGVAGLDYLLTALKLSMDGLDASEAAFHLLSYPKFQAHVPQHAMTMGLEYSFVSLMISMDEKFYLDKALARIRTETGSQACRALVILLWYADTDEARKAIADVAGGTMRGCKDRKLAEDMMAADGKMGEEPAAQSAKLYAELKLPLSVSYTDLKKARQTRMNRISDEALLELDQITFLIKRKRMAGDAGKD